MPPLSPPPSPSPSDENDEAMVTTHESPLSWEIAANTEQRGRPCVAPDAIVPVSSSSRVLEDCSEVQPEAEQKEIMGDGEDKTEAVTGEKAIDDLAGIEGSTAFSFIGLIRFSGTGFMAAVAFLDPGNLEADINTGVSSRYSLLWWYAVCILGFAFCFQMVSAKLGLITGSDLAVAVNKCYPKHARYLLWFLLELSILAADIQETIGCALGVRILSGGTIPLWACCIVVSAAAMILLQADRIGYRPLELVYVALIALESGALVAASIQTGAPAGEVFRGLFVPTLNSATVLAAAGALGALVMPYNTFFQSHVVNGRPRDTSTDKKKTLILKYMKIETFLVLCLCLGVNICVVVTFANFYGTPEAEGAGLQSASELLASQFGRTVELMWSIGLVSSGLVATLCLTYAGQIIMCGLLQVNVSATWRLMVTRFLSLIPCLALAVVFEATNTFDKVAQLINIIQAICLPFGLIPAVQMTADKRIMGEKWASAKWLTGLMGLITLSVVGVNVFTFVTLLEELSVMSENNPRSAAASGAIVGFSCLIAVYLSLVSYFAVGPSRWEGVIRGVRSRAHALWVHRRWVDIESMLEV